MCVRETGRLAEGDGCVSVQGRMNTRRVQVESRFALCVLDKVYAAEISVSFFEVARGHFWRVCSCVGRQRGGNLVIPLKRLRSRCAVALFA